MPTRDALSRVPGVIRVDFDRSARPAYMPNDPLWPQLWHFRTIKADLAWDTSKGIPVTVAVIDTGLNRNHEDLAANVWVNPGEIPNNGIDDDNNGYIDDVNGWDFAYNDNNADDVYGHGTPCAGIVAAVQDNGIGMTGVAPRAKIMGLKACLDEGYLYDSFLIPAYVYAANMGAHVFSMSYFSDRVSAAERDAMDYAVGLGVLPVAAAGNSASSIPHYPGGYLNVLSVAAVDGASKRSSFSCFGSWVDVAAPGEGLLATGAGGGYVGFGGTSGACPHVAGLAALLFGAKPTATASEVRAAIEDTAQTLTEPPFGEFSNYGLIDCDQAVRALLTTPAPPKAAVVRSVGRLGQRIAPSGIDPSRYIGSRVYGRGFEGLGQLRVMQGQVQASLLGRGRDWFEYRHQTSLPGDVTVWNGNELVASIPNPLGPRVAWPLADSVVTGDKSQPFWQAVADDGLTLDSNREGDGVVRMSGVFRDVSPVANAQLRLRRRYLLTSGTEHVFLYDWTSGSYPYGQWVKVFTGSCPTSFTTTTVNLGPNSPYIDPEGSVYVKIETSSGASGQGIRLDSLRMQQAP